MSFYEIYCEKAFDLLNSRKQCNIREDGHHNVHIVDLVEQQVEEPTKLMRLIQSGLQARVTSQTGMNDTSSRSHAILQIMLRTHNNKVHGRMSFIDLAGSERGSDVKDSQSQTRNDGKEINKSLLALKECKLNLSQALEILTRERPMSSSDKAS